MGLRSVNEVILIGWIANDPILKSTKNSQNLVVFNIATRRVWMTKDGEKKEEIQYHKAAAWGKLAEKSDKILEKGLKVYIRGYLHNRKIQIDGEDKSRVITEIIVNDLLVLDRKSTLGNSNELFDDKNEMLSNEDNYSMDFEIDEIGTK
ncbi:MAG: single-stranded DNA-binding protein [Candidatus Absconditabacteria bacterium]